MMDDHKQHDNEENLRSENDFLKMKLMLEHGAKFDDSNSDENSLPPEVENEFLNNIMAFEKQFAEHKTIKVFDKIGRPEHFKPVAEIPEESIEQAWEELDNYMNERGINLDVCSSNITNRELYRFVIEELFVFEMDDIDMPGWTHNFIYDEFYPDPVYENTRAVENDLFGDIFCKEEMRWNLHYAKDGFSLNDVFYNDFKEYAEKINRFKSLFDEVSLSECTISNCTVNEKDSFVTGNYKALAKTGNEEMIFSGDFIVKFVIDDLGYWDMKEIQVKGLSIT